MYFQKTIAQLHHKEQSYYHPEHKGGSHRSFKPIGYLHELQTKGMADVAVTRRKGIILSNLLTFDIDRLVEFL